MEIPKIQWHHAPPHVLVQQGVYMVTGSTLGKEHHFRRRAAIEDFTQNLLTLADEFEWQLQAWAVFSNHYHFVAVSPEDPQTLPAFIQRLHGRTSRNVNKLDGVQGRQVWLDYWDTRLTFHKSYLARLAYTMDNPVRHGLVNNAVLYRWCSTGWFEREAPSSFVRTVKAISSARINVADEYEPVMPTA